MVLAMTVRFHALAVSALLSLTGLAHADKVDDLVTKYMAATHVPGLSLTVLKNGRPIKEQGYGMANLETQTKVTSDTVFEIGSCTKQFTAALVIKLASEGKLSLDDPLSKYFDGLPDSIKPITIRRCLSHTSGLYEYLALGIEIRKDYRTDDILERIKSKPLDFAPGEAWSYSNAGYFVAGMIIEKLTGKTWGQAVQEQIFKPLGMSESYIQSVPTVIPHRASGYAWGGKNYQNSEVLRPGSAYAAGAILSTGPDLAKWVVALDAGKFPGVAQAWEPFKLNGGRTYPYGMGWFLGKAWGQPVVQHGGNTYGQSAQISRYPQEGLTVIVLTNAAGQSFVGLADQVAKEYLEHVVVKDLKPQPDPDKARTSKLIDALEQFKVKEPDTKLVGTELRALMGTVRGTAMKNQIRNGLGQIRALIYLGEEKSGSDTEIYYEVVGSKARNRLTLLVDSEGRLIRLSGLSN